MIVVSDASPIISLQMIGRLALLEQIYATVIIPGAVASELGRGPAGRSALESAPWIDVRSAPTEGSLTHAEGDLGIGETEAIRLALACGAEILLIDERRGRRIAESLGLRPVGVVGVLIQARQRALIEALGPELAALVRDARCRLSKDLCRHALRAVGEEG